MQIQEVRVQQTAKQTKPIIKFAAYETDDEFLKEHLDEINRAYTYQCYTATFILCRKVLENLISHHIIMKKYPDKSEEHKGKYFDFDKGRFLDFERLLGNLRSSSKDFGSEKKLVERICGLADAFKDTANDMTHSLYYVAKKKEIDDKNFQDTLDLIGKLEKTL